MEVPIQESLLRTLYFLVPVAFANMAPVLIRRYFSFLAYPLDFKQKLFGKRIFGDHKTFRGLIFGIIGGLLGALFLRYLYINYFVLRALSIVNYERIDIYLYGFLLGLGVIAGDAFGSFIKRRFDLKPGESLVPLDQIVAPLGAMLFILPIYQVSLDIFLLALVVSVFMHILIKRIGYFLKIENKKW